MNGGTPITGATYARSAVVSNDAFVAVARRRLGLPERAAAANTRSVCVTLGTVELAFVPGG